jgi:hypothetical protein
MGLLSSLKGLFAGSGGGPAAAADPIDYNGFSIEPAPERRDGGWNTAGVIRKTVGEELKEHRFVRVDTHASRDDAIAFSVIKAQQIIDEQGDRIFEGRAR